MRGVCVADTCACGINPQQTATQRHRTEGAMMGQRKSNQRCIQNIGFSQRYRSTNLLPAPVAVTRPIARTAVTRSSTSSIRSPAAATADLFRSRLASYTTVSAGRGADSCCFTSSSTCNTSSPTATRIINRWNPPGQPHQTSTFAFISIHNNVTRATDSTISTVTGDSETISL